MIIKIKTILWCLMLSLLVGCGNSSSSSSNREDESSYNTDESDDINDGNIDEENDYASIDDDDSALEDGTYTATVDYYNPNTGYSNTYTLDVEVENNQVVQIDFPNDGYLDDSHIDPEELDANRQCSIEDDEGRIFDIQINQ
ncbi:MAG: hypothetical protein KAZ28_03165 [Bacteroidaceae bacterium]|nr:hypothetical protein [Bacteroidaceae bacterium]